MILLKKKGIWTCPTAALPDSWRYDMTRLITLVVALALTLFASAAAVAQTNTIDKSPYYGYEKVVIAGQSWSAPDYINLGKFPPLGGKLSSRDARILQLHQEPLGFSGWFVNELRERRTFEVIWLDKGTMVWVSNGSREARYLESCGNRISFLLSHELKQVTTGPTTQPLPEVKPMTFVETQAWPKLRVRDFWRNLGEGIKNVFLYGPFLVPDNGR
jgi:hypothetical protein